MCPIWREVLFECKKKKRRSYLVFFLIIIYYKSCVFFFFFEFRNFKQTNFAQIFEPTTTTKNETYKLFQI